MRVILAPTDEQRVACAASPVCSLAVPLFTGPSPGASARRTARRLLTRIRGALLRVVFALPTSVRRRLAGAPVVVDGARLDTNAQLLLRLRDLSGEPPVEDLPLEHGRRALRADARLVGGSHPVGAVRDLVIPGPAGSLPARSYLPTGGRAPAPTLVFLHGGGGVYGDLDSHDATCRFLCEQAGVRVLAVGYRLAPEHPFPAAVEDAYAAYAWAAANAERIGADPDRLAVGGDSFGGNLAAVVALLARDDPQVTAPALQLLVYPAVDFTTRRPSRDTFRTGFYLTDTFIDTITEAYLPDPADRRDPRASPLLAAELRGLPPAHVVTAEFDPLLDEGRAYADALRDAGVGVTYVCEEGLIHSFANTLAIGCTGRAAMVRVAAALREGLSR
jgi:acetyl esterase